MGVAQSSLDCAHRKRPTLAGPGLPIPFSPSECLSGNYDPTLCSVLTVARGKQGELRMLDVSGELRFVCKGLGSTSEVKCKSKPTTICDAMGEPLCVVERVQRIMSADASAGAAVVQGGFFRVIVKGEAVAELMPTSLYTDLPNKLDPGFVYSVRRRELLSATQRPDLLRGRRIVLRRTVPDGQEAPVAGSMLGSSTRLGASWTITTAPAVDVLAVLSIFVALTCMGGDEVFGPLGGKRATPMSSPSRLAKLKVGQSASQ